MPLPAPFHACYCTDELSAPPGPGPDRPANLCAVVLRCVGVRFANDIYLPYRQVRRLAVSRDPHTEDAVTVLERLVTADMDQHRYIGRRQVGDLHSCRPEARGHEWR